MRRLEAIVPFTPGCEHRSRAFRHVKGFLPGTPTVSLGGQPWIKAQAVNPAVERSSARVVAVVDADVICEGLEDAIAEVENGAPWAIPHSHVHRLTEQGTANVLNGEPWEEQELEQRPYLGVLGGGCVVAHREVLESVPMDPRFVGWGQEDECWAMALTTLAGPPVRLAEPLVHLYHPPQQRLNRRMGSAQGWALRRRYLRARHDPAQMRALIEEVRGDHAVDQPQLHPREEGGRDGGRLREPRADRHAGSDSVRDPAAAA